MDKDVGDIITWLLVAVVALWLLVTLSVEATVTTRTPIGGGASMTQTTIYKVGVRH